MLDFVKLALGSDTAEKLLANPRLNFYNDMSEQTGEVIEYPKKAKYKCLKIKMKSPNYCQLSGSLHKFAHSGRNYTDFHFAEAVSAINQLEEELGIIASEARLQNLEAGVNLTDLPASPSAFIRSVLSHKGKAFGNMRNYYGSSIGIDCYHQRYGIKIYDKGKQYKLSYPVLRFEVKHTRMYDLNKLGIVSLANLANPNVWTLLAEQVHCSFGDLLMNDPTLRAEGLKGIEQRKLADYQNPKYWEDLKRKSAKNHDYHRQRYRRMIKQYVPYPIQSVVAEKCREKMVALFADDRKV